jgi:putative DNA primase/helicase
MLRAIIDPSAAPLCSLPCTEPDLLALATLNWILAFDHIGQVRPNISATLCRLATGAAVRQREKGDDREPTVQELHRPILITAAAAWNPDESLADRTLTLRLKPLPTRRPEAELFEEFEAIRPTLLAALCNATATALHERSQVPSPEPPAPRFAAPRLPDAALWAIAGFPEHAPGIRAAMNQTPTTPILESVAELLKTSPQWTGTATDLLHEIAVTTVTAPALSHHLRTHKNHLASQNISVYFTRKHGGSRVITLAPSPQPRAPSTYN